MSVRVDPARPGAPVLPDGRPRQQIASYSRRGSRLSSRQQDAWDRRAEQWLIPASAAEEPWDQARWFGRQAPLVAEIGSGVGEALACLAGARPEHDVLGIEVWRPGIASTFAHLEQAGVTNVRMLPLDAAWALEHLLPSGRLRELWTFFPDPWHKTRHHKRRLVTPTFARLAASRLAPGGRWRLATDWGHYAAQIRRALDAEPWLAGGVVERWEERPVTKFERRARAEGREVTDLCYTRPG